MGQIIVAGAMALALGGCATVTRGTGEQIQVNSDPQGAEARTSLGFQCITPCTLNVQRKDEFSITIAKPGFEPQTVPVMTRVAGAGVAGFAGNVLVGGIVGMGVDAATGATLEHYPNPVTVVLRPLAPPPGSPRGRAKQPPVAQRPPAPPPVAPVAQAPVEPEPQLSEQDRAMNSRN
jgi:hypothetical protein